MRKFIHSLISTLCSVSTVLCLFQTAALAIEDRLPHSGSNAVNPLPQTIQTEPLSLNVTSGRCPLTVLVAGPDDFSRRSRQYETPRFGFLGEMSSIDWGDGSKAPHYVFKTGKADSQELLRHTYTVPGQYTVVARTSHLGPRDEPVFDWSGRTVVTVGDAAQLNVMPPPAVHLNLDIKSRTPENYVNLPYLRWSLQTNCLINLHFYLMDGTTVIGEEFEGQLAHDIANEEIRVGFVNSEKYKSAMKLGHSQFYVRAVATDRKRKVLACRDSGYFFMKE